ncbi:MAG: LLM class F420-dependent oxidoreductase [Caldilineaceae bacterium]|nr:LLM class F420-dependent oxidoreductase [Caldilineaceae bacterium]
MRIGAVFPQIEFPADAAAVRSYAQAVDELGYAHILAFDHVLGANPHRPGGWQGPYTHTDPFYEPFILYAYMTAVAPRLEFVTGIIILPQRQTALVAKQTATLDVLCRGQLRLGMGIGWNQVEFEALNENFRNRGKRVEEQIALLRKLWTEPLVTFDGEWHTVSDAGLNPLPVQRPIPIWLGGHADVVLRRVARLGDGWMPNYRTVADAQPALDTLAGYLDQAGRSASEVGLEPRLSYGDGNLDRLARSAEEWQAAGATHISINTMGAGLSSPDEHIAALARFAESAGIST